MTREHRAQLENLADTLESIARQKDVREQKEHMSNIAPKVPNNLFAIAWDIKQIARWNTASFGI